MIGFSIPPRLMVIKGPRALAIGPVGNPSLLVTHRGRGRTPACHVGWDCEQCRHIPHNVLLIHEQQTPAPWYREAFMLLINTPINSNTLIPDMLHSLVAYKLKSRDRKGNRERIRFHWVQTCANLVTFMQPSISDKKAHCKCIKGAHSQELTVCIILRRDSSPKNVQLKNVFDAFRTMKVKLNSTSRFEGCMHKKESHLTFETWKKYFWSVYLFSSFSPSLLHRLNALPELHRPVNGNKMCVNLNVCVVTIKQL